MKVNELMIGDWVYAKLYPNRKEPRQIEDIYGKLFNAEIWYGYEIQGGCELADAAPIPLTPEILEKNGFVGDEAKNYDYDECVWVKYDMDLSCPPILTIKYSYCHFFKQINYVHELQHALRICGLTNLADNFKVE